MVRVGHALHAAAACLMAGTSLAVGATSFAADAQTTSPRGLAHADRWPAAHSQGLVDRATEAKISKIMAGMSLEEKIGQMIQADVASISPEDLRHYPLGSILAGGSSPPLGAPDRSAVGPWLATVRAFSTVALEKRKGHTPIPIMFGIDAVHGHNNEIGRATRRERE